MVARLRDRITLAALYSAAPAYLDFAFFSPQTATLVLLALPFAGLLIGVCMNLLDRKHSQTDIPADLPVRDRGLFLVVYLGLRKLTTPLII